MKDKPIENSKDPKYTINYNKEAYDTYNLYFSNDNTDVTFLNGKWGSGKTSFLNIVFDRHSSVKKYTVDLWRVTNNQDTSEIVYKKVFPYSYRVIKYFFFLLFIILSGISFYLSKLDFSPSLSYLFLVSGLLSGLNQIIGKINYSNLFLYFLKARSNIIWKKKIIIIDDFDRISSQKQDELYKIFNLLSNSKIQFIFLGNYNSISHNQSGYLYKIIDRRIELPYSLSPSNIWNEYFKIIIETINKHRSSKLTQQEKTHLSSLKNLLIKKEHTLRDKKIFENYIKEFLFRNKRFDKINLDQQLVIIYLYLFENEKYNILVSHIEDFFNTPFDTDKNYQKNRFIKLFTNTNSNSSNLDINLIWDVLIANSFDSLDTISGYNFDDFRIHYPTYLINYTPLNLSDMEIKSMLFENNEDLAATISKNTKKRNKEIYNYIRRNQNNITKKELIYLYTSSIRIIQKGFDRRYFNENNDFSYFVNLICNIQLNKIHNNEIHNYSVSNNYSLDTESYNKLLLSNVIKINQNDSAVRNLDLSQKILLYHMYFHIPLNNLEPYYNNLKAHQTLKSKTLSDFMYPEYIIAILFHSIEQIDNELINEIVSLNDLNFYNLLYLFGRYNLNSKSLQIQIKENNLKKIFEERATILIQDGNRNIKFI